MMSAYSPKPEVLLVEDDPIMGESLAERLALEGFDVEWQESGAGGLQRLARRVPDILLMDLRLPDMSGAAVFERIRRDLTYVPPTLFITAYGSIEQAVELLQAGAVDYVTKPLDLGQLIGKLRGLAEGVAARGGEAGGEVLGISSAMRAIEQRLPALARHPDTPVLITGESGVGKEVVAEQLHREQGTAGRFVAVNCAAIPESLIEAQLFGHEKGAFTGASAEHRGYFEQASGGTLFLDEIGDMPFAAQAKLLRVIQERRIVRLGGDRALPVSLRLVCATHRDLRQWVADGRFREDLYYRIHVVTLDVPPLRERREDILWLAERFLAEHAVRYPEERRTLGVEARQRLVLHDWPGNVRELKHVIERACILAHGTVLQPADLGMDSGPEADREKGGANLQEALQAVEREQIVNALKNHGWRVAETAALLGISRKSLWQKMKRLQIEKPAG
jgi:DNA-binding NtrC family response regulator